jgi:hypothetical protein
VIGKQNKTCRLSSVVGFCFLITAMTAIPAIPAISDLAIAYRY